LSWINRFESSLKRAFAARTLGGWVGLFIAVVIGRTILDSRAAESTNRAYLRKLLDTKTVEQTASKLVAVWKSAGQNLEEGMTWEDLERRLSECTVAEARRYLESGDPYLNERADDATPKVLVGKFFGACGAADGTRARVWDSRDE
jgi:hypothetical protein